MATKIEVYARHSANCPHTGGRGSGSDSYAKCNCRKGLRWSLNGKQHRRNANTRSWAQAEEMARQLEKDIDNAATGRLPAPVELDRKTITQAVEHFLLVLRQSGRVRDENAFASYERDLKNFDETMSKRGKFYPAQVTEDDIVAAKATWDTFTDNTGTVNKTAASTKKIKQQRIKKFMGHCLRFKLIEAVPHMDKIHIPEDEQIETIPLVMEGYHEAFDKLLGKASEVFKEEKAVRVRGILLVMRWSGLAVHDAVTLRRDGLKAPNGKPYYRIERKRTKTGVAVSNVIPAHVAKELLEVPNTHPDYFFYAGSGTPKSATTNWKKDLKKLFVAAGLPDGHPHQLRDLAAISLLEKGVSMQDVSKFLGHKSITTTEKYYSKWVPARQARLDDVVASAWS